MPRKIIRLRLTWHTLKCRAERLGITLIILSPLSFLLLLFSSFKDAEHIVLVITIFLAILALAFGLIAVSMAYMTDIRQRYHEGQTEEEAYSQLDLARLPGEDITLHPGVEQILYDSRDDRGDKQSPHPFLFGNAWVILPYMSDQDIVKLRMKLIEKDNEPYIFIERIVKDQNNKIIKLNDPFYNQYGVIITAEMVSGNSTIVRCVVYNARRS